MLYNDIYCSVCGYLQKTTNTYCTHCGTILAYDGKSFEILSDSAEFEKYCEMYMWKCDDCECENMNSISICSVCGRYKNKIIG